MFESNTMLLLPYREREAIVAVKEHLEHLA